MEIRKSTEQDLEAMLRIYGHARAFMAEHGNPHQWGDTVWPPVDLLHRDIAEGKSLVCVEDGQVVGTFFFDMGKDVEPTYTEIRDGQWLDESPYGVIHRLAGDGVHRGVGEAAIRWALTQCPHLRVDTHGDNKVVQNMLTRLGFTRCGTIYVVEDNYPRLAYEKLI